MSKKNEMTPDDKLLKAIYGEKYKTEAEMEAEIDEAVNNVDDEEFKRIWGCTVEEHTHKMMLFAGFCDAVVQWERNHYNEKRYHADGDFTPHFSTRQVIDMAQMFYEQGQEDAKCGISEYDRLHKVNRGEPVPMKKSIDDRVAEIMYEKDLIGEFSLDLYYNDCDDENPYTARIHSAIDAVPEFHARAKSFSDALDSVEEYIKSL